MPQRLNGLTRKSKVLYIIESPQQIMQVLHRRRKICTKNSIFNLVQAIQIDCNAHGADECISNVHANNE